VRYFRRDWQPQRSPPHSLVSRASSAIFQGSKLGPLLLHNRCWMRKAALRSAERSDCVIQRCNNTFGDRSFAVVGPRACNDLPVTLRNTELTMDTFCKHLKTVLFTDSWSRGAFVTFWFYRAVYKKNTRDQHPRWHVSPPVFCCRGSSASTLCFVIIVFCLTHPSFLFQLFLRAADLAISLVNFWTHSNIMIDWVTSAVLSHYDGFRCVGTMYLEFWKREQARIQFRWSVTNFEKEEVWHLQHKHWIPWVGKASTVNFVYSYHFMALYI